VTTRTAQDVTGGDPGRSDGSAISCDFRANKFSYIALGTLPLGFSIIFIYFAIFGHYDSDHPVWPFALLACAVLSGVLSYLGYFRITVRDGTLSYRTLWRGTRTIRLADIKEARVDVKLLATPPRRPPYALFLEPLPGTGKEPLVINIKFLSREDLRKLMEILGDKVSR
jgi:hypothetical protein